MSTPIPSSIDSILNRVRRFRTNLDNSFDSDDDKGNNIFNQSSFGQNNNSQFSQLHELSQLNLNLSDANIPNINISLNNNANNNNQSPLPSSSSSNSNSNQTQNRDKNEPFTPTKFSTDTVSSTNVIKSQQQPEHPRHEEKKSDGDHLQVPSSSTAHSSMSISTHNSPSSFQPLLAKMQDFNTHINESTPSNDGDGNTPNQHQNHNTDYLISTPLFRNGNNERSALSLKDINDSPSLLQQQMDLESSDNEDDMKINPLNLSNDSNMSFRLNLSKSPKPKQKPIPIPRAHPNPKPNLSVDSQIIANVPPQYSHRNRNKSKSKLRQRNQGQISIGSDNEEKKSNSNGTRMSKSRQSVQNVDLKQFLDLPSPPKQQKSQKRQRQGRKYQALLKPNDVDTKQLISPFHDRYRAQMKHILGISQAPISSTQHIRAQLSTAHYNYASSVSNEPLIPSHIVTALPNESLQSAYKKHKARREMKKKLQPKHNQIFNKNLNKHKLKNNHNHNLSMIIIFIPIQCNFLFLLFIIIRGRTLRA